MLHAMRNPQRVLPQDGWELVIGADRAGRLLEVGVRTGETDDVTFTRCLLAPSSSGDRGVERSCTR